MSRRKEIKITIKNMSKVQKDAVNVFLQAFPELKGYDFKTFKFSLLKEYEPQIKDVDKAISNLKYFRQTKRQTIENAMFDGVETTNKKLLAEMLGIARGTLDTWIDSGFITPVTFMGKYLIFPSDMVLEQLESYRDKRNNEK